MKFKMIIAFLPDHKMEKVLAAARKAGATGSTVITSARGEGLEPAGKFLGLEIASHRNLVFWLVDQKTAPGLLHAIAAAGRFDEERGAGIACQIDVEDAVGLTRQFNSHKDDDGKPAGTVP